MNIDDQIEQIFSNVLTEIISIVSGFYLEVQSQDRDNSFDDITAVMSLCGKENILIFISAKEKDIRILCSFITGIPQEEVTKADMEDTLCELVNMTAGSAKLRLGGAEFTLSPPFSISGSDMSIAVKNKTQIVSKVLGNHEISVKLKVVH